MMKEDDLGLINKAAGLYNAYTALITGSFKAGILC